MALRDEVSSTCGVVICVGGVAKATVGDEGARWAAGAGADRVAVDDLVAEVLMAGAGVAAVGCGAAAVVDAALSSGLAAVAW